MRFVCEMIHPVFADIYKNSPVLSNPQGIQDYCCNRVTEEQSTT